MSDQFLKALSQGGFKYMTTGQQASILVTARHQSPHGIKYVSCFGRFILELPSSLLMPIISSLISGQSNIFCNQDTQLLMQLLFILFIRGGNWKQKKLIWMSGSDLCSWILNKTQQILGVAQTAVVIVFAYLSLGLPLPFFFSQLCDSCDLSLIR